MSLIIPKIIYIIDQIILIRSQQNLLSELINKKRRKKNRSLKKD